VVVNEEFNKAIQTILCVSMSSEMWAFLSPGTLREGISLVRAV
jgi:hypothetical protein